MIKCPVVLTVLLLWAGQNTYAQGEAPDSIILGHAKSVASVKVGIASYYHDKFEGRATASGQIFSQKKMTAASNSYPLGSWVRVTNLSNERSVTVRINDRMHPKNKRLIDLTKAGAAKLGFIGRGLTKVRVEYLGRKRPAGHEQNRRK